MPNHLKSWLSIDGPEKAVRRFIASVSTAISRFDFNGIVSMPKELESIEPMNELKGENDPRKIDDLKRQKLIAKFGEYNWYDWACSNWGTKWNAYNVGHWRMKTDKNHRHSFASIYFTTANSPATVIVRAAALKHPKLNHWLCWHDEFDGCFRILRQREGRFLLEEKFYPHSEEGKVLANWLGIGSNKENISGTICPPEIKLAVIKMKSEPRP